MKITKNNLQDIYRSKQVSIETMELKGYKLIENLFVDNSRMGAEDEPALTMTQFEKRVLEILEKYGQVYATITDAGQFQVYIGLFEKVEKSRVTKIANNTYERIEGNKRIIRLHNTDIVVFDSEKDTITLNTGGFYTHTTKARINEYLPSGSYYVYQSNFDWFVHDIANEKTIDYKDGLTLSM